MLDAFASDSFWTLSPAARAGLAVVAALSAAGAVLLLWPALRLWTAGRVAAALGVLWLYLWLSPQGFYAFYGLIFDVPAQWVAGGPPGPMRVVRALTFTEEASLSRVAQGLLGWALLLLALRGRR